MPRVYGGFPGAPSAASGSQPSRSAGPYTGLISMPESVSRRSSALRFSLTPPFWRLWVVAGTAEGRQNEFAVGSVGAVGHAELVVLGDDDLSGVRTARRALRVAVDLEVPE